MITTSIIVPCYNEEDNISLLVERFSKTAFKDEFELILVDNGSSDGTSAKIDECMENNPFVKKVTIQENIGYGNGILKGLENATGKYLGWIHADLQSEPEVFEGMIKAAKEETQPFLYKGARKGRSFQDMFFTIGMAVFESLYFGMRLWDVNSQPTLLSRRYYERWKNPPKDFSLDIYAYVLAKKAKVKISRFASPQHPRYSGTSTWNVNWNSRFKMVKRVIGYSIDTKRRIKAECR